MKLKSVIRIEQGVCRNPESGMNAPIDFELLEGEQIALMGPNGGGKSRLVDILTGRYSLQIPQPYYDFGENSMPLVADNIKCITFKDSYGNFDRTYYQQQRWESTEIDNETPTVGSLLDKAYKVQGYDTEERRKLRHTLYTMFNLEPLLDRYIILLSSGELRKFMITRTLLSNPKVLIMDNPFIGLDDKTREQLKNLLSELSKNTGLQLILLLSKIDDMPDFITHVVHVEDMKVGKKLTREEYLNGYKMPDAPVLSDNRRQEIIGLPYNNKEYNAQTVVSMHNVRIQYGNTTILNNLSWDVKNGERWALRGQNGAGKSTLLSLVCADNPQSYACDITLFDRKRGSGETIWEIKKHIGYVSPEMHRAYHHDLPAIRIVASGMNDTIGLYTHPTEEEYDACRKWMHIFGLDGLEDRTFMKMSSGEQRLVLLARAFVKDPELLVLDEPLHGLDDRNRRMVKDIIEAFCSRRNKTLIMVTHYQEELPQCIDHTIVLKRD